MKDWTPARLRCITLGCCPSVHQLEESDLKDLTPMRMRCDVGASCPSVHQLEESDLKDFTPVHLRCVASGDCPSVHQTKSGDLLIVGKVAPFLDVDEDGKWLHPEDWPVNVGTDETAIIIPAEYLSDYVKAQK